jgi:glutamate-1-semialdehyde 2,1-aminomutase
MMASNPALLQDATNLLPGASLGSFYLPEKDDLVIDRGAGSHVWDVAGREFIDCILGSGPMVIGHAHPAVVAAVTAQIARGASFYALNEPAIRLADKIVKAAPCAEAVKFCGAGAEATFYALRLARAATGREKILKFEGGYHGHHDYALMSVWPKRLDPFPAAAPDSAGIPRSVADHVLIAPFNDLATTVAIMERHKDDLAAVIVEPLSRMLAPVPGFLEGVREATRRLGAVLIFDEVVTGFRVAYGGAQELYGVVPDLACYGKIVGGGLPLAAIAGKRDIIELANPRKKGSPDYTYISGTLNGNPVSCAAGLATIAELEKPGAYDRLRAVGDRLRAGLRAIASRLSIPAQVLGHGPLANIYFTPDPVIDYRSSLKSDSRLTQLLGSELLARGVLTNLAAKMYLSLAHSDRDIDTTLQAFEDSLKAITAGRR